MEQQQERRIEERLDRAVDKLERALQRIEDKLDSKHGELERRLRTVEQKVAWYAGGAALAGAIIGFVGHWLFPGMHP